MNDALIWMLVSVASGVIIPLALLGVFRMLERRLARASALSTGYRKATLSGRREDAFTDDEKARHEEDIRSAERRAALAFGLALIGAPLAVAVIGLVPLVMSIVFARSSNHTMLNYNRTPTRAARTASTIAWIALIAFAGLCMVGIPFGLIALKATAGLRELEAGKQKMAAGDYSGAASDLSESIEKNSDNVEGYTRRALCYLELDKPQAALEDCDKALQIRRSFALAHYARARAHAALEKFHAALSDAEEAIRLDDAHSDSYVIRAQAHAAQGNSDSALADFARAVKLVPQNHRAYYFRGRYYMDAGNGRAAIPDFENVLKLCLRTHPMYQDAKERLARLKTR